MAVRSENQVISHDDPISLKPSLRSTKKVLATLLLQRVLATLLLLSQLISLRWAPLSSPLEWRGILGRI